MKYGRAGARHKMKGDLGTSGSPTGRGMPAGKGTNVNVSGPPMNSGLSRVRARRRKVRGPGRGAGSIRRQSKGPKIPY